MVKRTASVVSFVSHVCLDVVSQLSHSCLTYVSRVSHRRLMYVSNTSLKCLVIHCRALKCRESDRCIRRKPAQSGHPGGLRHLWAVRCQTKENNLPQEKPKKIKEMTPPEGCVLCGGFKGPAAALAAGALRAPVSVRGTLTKSAGRPRRRSRWERPPHTKPVGTSKAKGRPRAAFCFGGWFRSVTLLAEQVAESNASRRV
jgi:ferredoxin